MASSMLAKKNAEHARKCQQKYADFPRDLDISYCDAFFDTYLCWPPTQEHHVAKQNCPPMRLSDTKRIATRQCGEAGFWLNRRNQASSSGWTNYTSCFPPEVQSLFMKVHDDYNNGSSADEKFEIAHNTRYLEIVGFTISFISLLISLLIFTHYRSLRNNRTRIHKNLFLAMVKQVLIRLIVYFDQAFIRNQFDDFSIADGSIYGIHYTPYLCEGTYVLLEYEISAMFMWMLVEGFYLHSMVTANSLRGRISHPTYLLIGWGLPVLLTGTWVVACIYFHQNDAVNKCWYGYNFSPLYWILQGPRLAVILINMVFLLNIMRVLIVKLRKSQNSEVQNIRKAARAAMVLVPLLGITNVLNMLEAPVDGSVSAFGFWSYITHFLRSFQGLFISLIYCFLNGEVRKVLRKSFEDHRAMRCGGGGGVGGVSAVGGNRRQRNSFFNFLSSSGERRSALQQQNVEAPEQIDDAVWIPMKTFKYICEPDALCDLPLDTLHGSGTSNIPGGSNQATRDEQDAFERISEKNGDEE